MTHEQKEIMLDKAVEMSKRIPNDTIYVLTKGNKFQITPLISIAIEYKSVKKFKLYCKIKNGCLVL